MRKRLHIGALLVALALLGRLIASYGLPPAHAGALVAGLENPICSIMGAPMDERDAKGDSAPGRMNPDHCALSCCAPPVGPAPQNAALAAPLRLTKALQWRERAAAALVDYRRNFYAARAPPARA